MLWLVESVLWGSYPVEVCVRKLEYACVVSDYKKIIGFALVLL